MVISKTHGGYLCITSMLKILQTTKSKLFTMICRSNSLKELLSSG
ncbi:MAG: hypothetical protein E7478_04815 [Ruminococcaceae bacterium]|nr:hypothetical protein [Oscillospiraceae bacterium]